MSVLPALPFFAAELAAEVLSRHLTREALADALDRLRPAGAPAPGACAGRLCTAPSPEAIRVAVAARAVEEWRRAVMEPPGVNAARIDSYIRGPEGLGWPSAALRGSSDSREYRRNGQFQWCGAFAAWCWSILDAEIRLHHFASTYRLDGWTAGNARRLTPEELLPGDLAIVGPRDKTAHITVVVGEPHEVDGIVSVETVEGNATGLGPAGKRYEGVIRRRRPFYAPDPRIYRVHFGVRPAAEDMDGR